MYIQRIKKTTHHVRGHEIQELLHLSIVWGSSDQPLPLTGNHNVLQPQQVAVVDPHVDQLVQPVSCNDNSHSARMSTCRDSLNLIVCIYTVEWLSAKMYSSKTLERIHPSESTKNKKFKRVWNSLVIWCMINSNCVSFWIFVLYFGV